MGQMRSHGIETESFSINPILQRVTPINIVQSGDVHRSAFPQRADDVQSHRTDGGQDAAEEAHDEGQ